MTEIAYIEKCMVCAKEKAIEAKPGEGEENPSFMDTICEPCMENMPASWGDVEFKKHAPEEQEPPQEFAREPVPLKEILGKKEFKDTEIPAYQIWNRWVRNEITREEFRDLLAKENIRFLREYEAWTYPVITNFVRRWASASQEEREEMKKSASRVEIKELDGYISRFAEVRAHNHASWEILCDTQENLLDAEEKGKLAEFITANYEPYWKTLHHKMFQEPAPPPEDWRNK